MSAGRTSDNGRRNGGSGPKPCRRIRQLVASAHGGRPAETRARLWCRSPEGYRQGRSVNDFWKFDRLVFEEDPTHRQVDPSAIWLT